MSTTDHCADDTCPCFCQRCSWRLAQRSLFHAQPSRESSQVKQGQVWQSTAVFHLSFLQSEATGDVLKTPDVFFFHFLMFYVSTMEAVSQGRTLNHRGHYLTHNIIQSHVCASDSNICSAQFPSLLLDHPQTKPSQPSPFL